MINKIVPYIHIDTLVPTIQDKRIVLCGGCFDIFHYGHLVFLRSAKESGDILCVQIESDDFIKRRKKRTPVHTQQQRAEVLASINVVDFVIPIPLFTTDQQYGDLVKRIRPDIIAVTQGDAAYDKKFVHAQAIGAEMKEVCPPFHSFSSSNIGKYEGIFGD